MTERGRELHATDDGQIAELIALISRVDAAALRLPCPGREKLGDGTVGASVRHTADNYQRIAGFIQTSDRMSGAHRPAQPAGHRVPRLLRAIGNGPADHPEHDPGAGQHDDPYTADDIDQAVVVEQLSAARDALKRLAQITDSRLDTIPPDGSFRFCDGQRTLEQVLAGLFKHQGHQLEALRAALARGP
jgi:hypothetical protein